MSIRLLLVDDHAMMLDGLKALFASATDMDVVGAVQDGRAALELAREDPPDVVLMDIAMPGLNGIEATRVMREKHPRTRVVILSMHSSPEHLQRALAAGADGYLLKESAGREALAAVRAVHLGCRYLSTALQDMEAAAARSAPDNGLLGSLSTREREVLQLVVEGRTSAEIGQVLNLSHKTVETYRSRLMKKVGVPDVTGLVKFALRHGIIALD